jgi:hypothetical protein
MIHATLVNRLMILKKRNDPCDFSKSIDDIKEAE